MRKKTIGLALASFGGLLIFFSWYLTSPNAPLLISGSDPEPVSQTANVPPSEPTDAAPETGRPAKPAPAEPTVAPQPQGLAAWELKIDEALRSQADHSTIAKALLQQVPYMPPEGQQAAAQHIINLIADKDYLDVLPYVQNPKIADGFQEIVVSESLNRPQSVKLQVLLASARMPKHPMKETALSILGLLLDQNHGNDWAKWEAAVNEALKQP